MPMFKNICRICLQEVDFHEVEEINLNKLNILKTRPYLGFPFLSKWEIELFRNHLICETCIHNFRTIKEVYRESCKASTAIVKARNGGLLSKVNLRRLQRFRHLDGDFIVCRLCLKPTRQSAVYLYDNSKNILPVEYIEKMLKFTKIYMNLHGTINPILCHLCWQNIQISYSFIKHLELVTEKIFYYQTIVDKIYIDREDLPKVLAMWDSLGIPNIKTERKLIIKKKVEEGKLEIVDNKSNNKRFKKLEKSVGNVKKEYSIYNDHNYFTTSTNESSVFKNRVRSKGMEVNKQIKSFVEESDNEMPKLTSTLDDCFNEMPKLKPNIDMDINISYRQLRNKIPVVKEKQMEEKINSTINNRQQNSDNKPKTGKIIKILNVITKRHKWKNTGKPKSFDDEERETKITMYEKGIASIRNNEKKELTNNSYKEKLRCITKHKEAIQSEKNKNKEQANMVAKRSNIKPALKSKQENRPVDPKTTELLKILLSDNARPRTRLSTRNEITEDLFSKDLLILTKEEIIKKKRQSRKLNVSVPEYTSTPIQIKNVSKKKNVSLPDVENSPLKSNTNVEYTFDSLRLDDDVQVKKEMIEEEELQIKRELLSECDSDDNFTENTECNTNDMNNFDDECPNLESFLKCEPLDDSYMIDLDEEEPPELEFQGPCNSMPIPIPPFTIQNTYTVDEKRHLINTADDKRNLLNMIDQKTHLTKSTVVDTSCANAEMERKNSLTPTGVKKALFHSTPLRSLTTTSNEKSPSIKINEDLFQRVLVPKIVEDQMPNLGVGETKCNKSSRELPEAVKIVVPDKANKTMNTSSRYRGDILSTYKRVDKQEIGPENLFNCDMCSFKTGSDKDARNHISLHITNSSLYKCELCHFTSSRKEDVSHHTKRAHTIKKCAICPFTSRKYIDVIGHMNRDHNQIESMQQTKSLPSEDNLCNYCNIKIILPITKKRCFICGRLFHAYCFTGDQSQMMFNCKHQSMIDFIGSKNVAVIEGVFSEYCMTSLKCNHCMVHIRKGLRCETCQKSYHIHCFTKNESECQHTDLPNVILFRVATHSEIKEGVRDKTKIDVKPCHLCQEPLVVRTLCPKCNKYMHRTCIKKHWKDLKCSYKPLIVKFKEAAIKKHFPQMFMKDNKVPLPDEQK